MRKFRFAGHRDWIDARLLLDRRRQRSDDRGRESQAAPRRRNRSRGVELAAMLRRLMLAAAAGLVLSASAAGADEPVHRIGVLVGGLSALPASVIRLHFTWSKAPGSTSA